MLINDYLKKTFRHPNAFFFKLTKKTYVSILEVTMDTSVFKTCRIL